MRAKKQLSQEKKEEPEFPYFEVLAYLGYTRHPGSLKATKN